MAGIHLHVSPQMFFVPQQHSSCCCHLTCSPKVWEVWLRSQIARGPCCHQVWASQLWMSDWIHLQSTYFCGFKRSQTGRILRWLAFSFSYIQFAPLYSFDLLPNLVFFSFFMSWFQSILKKQVNFVSDLRVKPRTLFIP